MTARQGIAFVAVMLYATTIAYSGSGPGKDLPPGTIPLHGAGSTFAAPLYKKWLEEYHRRSPTVTVSYDPIGSGEGTKQFMAGAVDFGASDAAMNDEEMAEVTRGVQLVPAVAGMARGPARGYVLRSTLVVLFGEFRALGLNKRSLPQRKTASEVRGSAACRRLTGSRPSETP
jgi:hypothetical protein